MSKGRAARQKGKRGEREVVQLFRAIYGEDVRRGWQARFGSDEPDIVIPPPLWIESKFRKRSNVYDALAQAMEDCPEDRIPVVMAKQNNKPRVMVMLAEDFVKLFAVLREWRERAEGFFPWAPCSGSVLINGKNIGKFCAGQKIEIIRNGQLTRVSAAPAKFKATVCTTIIVEECEVGIAQPGDTVDIVLADPPKVVSSHGMKRKDPPNHELPLFKEPPSDEARHLHDDPDGS